LQFSVLASPQIDGIFNAEIEIDSDDPSNPMLVVPMRCEGVQAGLKVDPFTVDFGNVSIGQVSAPQQVTVSCVGGLPVSFSGPTLVNGEPSQFRLVDASPFTLMPGQSKVIAVECAPTLTGEHISVLLITPDGFAAGAVKLRCTGATPHLDLAATVGT